MLTLLVLPVLYSMFLGIRRMPLHRRFKESASLRGLHWSTDKKALDSGYYEDARSRRLCDRRLIFGKRS